MKGRFAQKYRSLIIFVASSSVFIGILSKTTFFKSFYFLFLLDISLLFFVLKTIFFFFITKSNIAITPCLTEHTSLLKLTPLRVLSKATIFHLWDFPKRNFAKLKKKILNNVITVVNKAHNNQSTTISCAVTVSSMLNDSQISHYVSSAITL